MKRLLVWAGEHPWRALLVAAVIAALFGTGLPRVRFDASIESLRVPLRGDAESLAVRDQSVEAFGGQSVLTVIVEAPELFEAPILRAIEQMTWQLEGFEQVQRVVSLATVSALEAEDGFLNTEPLLAWVPETTEELLDLRRRALDQSVLRGEVVDEQGTAGALHVFVSDELDDLGERTLRAEVDEVIAAARRELAGAAPQLAERVEIYRVDEREIGAAMVEAIRRDSLVLVPFAGALVLLLIGWHFRRVAPLAAAVVPIVTGTLSIAATLGFMGWLGLELTPVAAIVPTLLLVVGCTEDVHLLAAWAHARRQGDSRLDAIAFMADHGATAILVTSLTTAIGFLTIVPNPLPILSEFGAGASFGMAINFVFTVLTVPALLRLLPSRVGASAPAGDQGSDAQIGKPTDRAGRWAEGVLRRGHWLPVGVGLFAALALWGTARVEVDTDYVSFLRSGHELRQRYDAASEAIAGAAAFWVVLDSGETDGALDPRWQQQLDRLASELDQRFDKVLGLRDFLRRMHRELNDGVASFDRIPESPELIAQYLLMLDPDDVERVLDFDRRRSALVVRSSPLSSGEMLRRLELIEQWVEREMPGTKVFLLGDSVIVSRASDAISRSLVGNLGLVLLTVLAILTVLFWSLRAGMLAMLPNLVPMLGVFAAMGWAGVPLSTATFPVAVIALGIAVDDTVHFMVRLAARSRAARDNRLALLATIRDEFAPVSLTSAALVIGFFGLNFGRLQSTAQFGSLAALAMALAWFADLAVAPLVLQRVPLIRMWDLLRLRIATEVMERCALFEGLSPRQARRVAVLGTLQEVAAGESVMAPGEDGSEDRDVVALLRGHLAVDPTSDQDSYATVARRMVLEPGSVVGEVAFFTAEQRSATVVALEPSEVLRVDAAGLERLERRDPRIAARVYFNLSRLLGERFREVQSELQRR